MRRDLDGTCEWADESAGRLSVVPARHRATRPSGDVLHLDRGPTSLGVDDFVPFPFAIPVRNSGSRGLPEK
jgi:hypothetical protein